MAHTPLFFAPFLNRVLLSLNRSSRSEPFHILRRLHPYFLFKDTTKITRVIIPYCIRQFRNTHDHADYRLLSKRATENLLDFDEVNLFLRGIVPMVGFQSTTVEYERGERFAGESKYPLGKMVTFAFEGITSLSVKPIRMITIGGLLICLISLIMLIKSFVDYFNGNVVPGWASIMVSIWVLGGLQIFAIGIIGEYIGKTYLETKKRPKYIIESVILDDKDISIDRNL